MRKFLIAFFCILIFIQIIWGVNPKKISKNYVEKSRDYFSTKNYLRIYSNSNTYNILEPIHFEDKIVSSGKISAKNKIITVVDTKTKERIDFYKVDKYRLTVVTKNSYFKNKDTLYLSNINGNNGVLEQISWKNGIKDGYLTVWSYIGVKNTLYENGVIKKIVFKTWDEIDKNVHVDSTQIMWYKP